MCEIDRINNRLLMNASEQGTYQRLNEHDMKLSCLVFFHVVDGRLVNHLVNQLCSELLKNRMDTRQASDHRLFETQRLTPTNNTIGIRNNSAVSFASIDELDSYHGKMSH